MVVSHANLLTGNPEVTHGYTRMIEIHGKETVCKDSAILSSKE